METKKFTILSLCLILIILIGICFGMTFYNNYIKPESYVNGEVKPEPYESTKLLDYMTSEDIIFSAELNKSVFSTTDTKSVCEYTFEHINFDGEKNTYGLYVNDYLLNNVTTTAGTISGDYRYKYYDPEKEVVCDSTIAISFTFYTLKTVARLELNAAELPYLMKNLQNNSFVVSIAKTDYKLVSDEKVNEQTATVTIRVNGEDDVKTAIVGSHITLPYIDSGMLKGWNVVSGNSIVNDKILTVGSENSVVEADLDAINYDIEFTGYTDKYTCIPQVHRGMVLLNKTGIISSSGSISVTTSGYVFQSAYLIDVGTGSYSVSQSINPMFGGWSYKITYENATKLIVKMSPVFTQITIAENGNNNVNEYPAGSTVTLTTPVKGYAKFKNWKVTEGNSTIDGNVLTVGTVASSIEPVFDEIPFNIDISADFKKTVNISVEGFSDVISLTSTDINAQYHGVISSSTNLTVSVTDYVRGMTFNYSYFNGTQTFNGNSSGMSSISINTDLDGMDMTTFDLYIEPLYLNCNIYANAQLISTLSLPSGFPFDLSMVDTSAYDLCLPTGWVQRNTHHVETEISDNILFPDKGCSVYRVYDNCSNFKYDYGSTNLDSLSLSMLNKTFNLDRDSSMSVPKSGTLILTIPTSNVYLLLKSADDAFTYSVDSSANGSDTVYSLTYSNAGDSLTLYYGYDYGVIPSGSTIIERSRLAQLNSSQLAYIDDQYYADENALNSVLNDHKNFGTAGVYYTNYNVYNVRINLDNFVNDSAANSVTFNFEIDGKTYSVTRQPWNVNGDIISGISISALFGKTEYFPCVIHLDISLSAFTDYIKLSSISIDGDLVYTAP